MNFDKIFALLYLLCVSYSLASEGFIEIAGQFLCNGESWSDEKVYVYESNIWFPDPLLIVNFTDSSGNFYLKGYAGDDYPPRPYVYMPNYCNAEKLLDREYADFLRIRVPAFYVGIEPQLLDMGPIELSHAGSDKIGFQKWTDWMRFAESRPIKKGRKSKMTES